MTADEILAALDLPDAARVERRIPKTLLLEHGAPTAADKRQINEGIEQAKWIAALKPTTIGVAAHRDNAREYLEIAVLKFAFRTSAKLARLVELVHRAVPYPVLLVAEYCERPHLSLAHKRRSQGEAGRTVLDDGVVAVDCVDNGEPQTPEFLAALSLERQPRSSLLVLYQGWMDTLLAFAAARRTRIFEIPPDAPRRAARRDALLECERLDSEIARLRAAAKKEKQMARQVELNLGIKRAEAARDALLVKL